MGGRKEEGGEKGREKRGGREKGEQDPLLSGLSSIYGKNYITNLESLFYQLLNFYSLLFNLY